MKADVLRAIAELCRSICCPSCEGRGGRDIARRTDRRGNQVRAHFRRCRHCGGRGYRVPPPAASLETRP